jgi:hypothetical protein
MLGAAGMIMINTQYEPVEKMGSMEVRFSRRSYLAGRGAVSTVLSFDSAEFSGGLHGPLAQAVGSLDRVSIPVVMVNWDVGRKLRQAAQSAQDFIMMTDTDMTYLPVNFTFQGSFVWASVAHLGLPSLHSRFSDQ